MSDEYHRKMIAEREQGVEEASDLYEDMMANKDVQNAIGYLEAEIAKQIDPDYSVTIEGLGTFPSMSDAFAEWNRQRFDVHNEIVSRIVSGIVGEHFVGHGCFVRIGEDGKVYNWRSHEDSDAPIIVSR